MQEDRIKVMKKLVIYIITFCLIISIVSFAITLFSQNVKHLKSDTDSYSNISKLNLYFLKITKEKDVIVKKYGLVDLEDDNSYFITFENSSGELSTFVKEGSNIYFNNILLCEDVEKFLIDIDNSIDEIISVKVKIAGQDYDLQYVMND